MNLKYLRQYFRKYQPEYTAKKVSGGTFIFKYNKKVKENLIIANIDKYGEIIEDGLSFNKNIDRLTKSIILSFCDNEYLNNAIHYKTRHSKKDAYQQIQAFKKYQETHKN